MSIAGRCRTTARTFSESLLGWPFSTRSAVLKCASLAAFAVAAGAAVSPAVAGTYTSKFPVEADNRVYDCWEYQRYDETGHWYVPGGQPLTRDAVLAKLKGLTAPGTELSDSTAGWEFYIKVKTDSHLVARYRRVPCPPPSQTTSGFAGFYIGADVTGNFNKLGQTETISGTDFVTSQLNDSSRAVGGGFNAGVLFPLANSPFLIGASGSIDLMRQDTVHTFLPGNFFIGQTINAIGTVNGQVGVVPKPGLLLFGEVGAAVVNIDQKLNFSGPVTSVNQNVTGLNVGVGAAYQPPDWQFAGNRVALVVQVNRTILPAVTFNNPGSPGFTNRNSNDVTTVKGGFRWGLGSPYNIWDTYSGVR
jgi:opacity protein-like surface antigen